MINNFFRAAARLRFSRMKLGASKPTSGATPPVATASTPTPTRRPKSLQVHYAMAVVMQSSPRYRKNNNAQDNLFNLFAYALPVIFVIPNVTVISQIAKYLLDFSFHGRERGIYIHDVRKDSQVPTCWPCTKKRPLPPMYRARRCSHQTMETKPE